MAAKTPFPKFIFVTGGVMSSLGKGLASASLGALLQARQFSVCLRKLDLYLNIDPGTLSPYQHGEVFVTDDGTEADLDLGHYERYVGRDTSCADYLTMGKVYSTIVQKERQGDYLGSTVQVIPHVTDELKKFITAQSENYDFVLIEIGGTVGDIEGGAALEAVRQLRNELGAKQTMFVHLTYLPYVKTAGELKTKPTQHSVKELLRAGIQPDLLLCRCEIPILPSIKQKLALFCNVEPEQVVAALDVRNIYAVPINYSQENFDQQVCAHFHVDIQQHPLEKTWLKSWTQLNQAIEHPDREITLAIVGKYTELEDSYKSIKESVIHAAAKHKVKAHILWCNSEKSQDIIHDIKTAQAIIVPGGFGGRGCDNMIRAIQYARENKVPFLGICFGMQMAIIEILRHCGGLPNANTTEIDPECEPVISLMSQWEDQNGGQTHRDHRSQKGGTMRLGAYPCHLVENSLAQKIYGQTHIKERHRHRYEFNLSRYGQNLSQAGMKISGISPDGRLTEVVEIPNHPWFIAVQFHPEFKSRPLSPHPLFDSLIEAALHRQKQVAFL